MTAPNVTQSDLPERIVDALVRVPAGLTVRQLVLSLGYADTDERAVGLALLALRGSWRVESYERSTPDGVVSVWQHRKYTNAHRILFIAREAA